MIPAVEETLSDIRKMLLNIDLLVLSDGQEKEICEMLRRLHWLRKGETKCLE